MNKIMFVVVCLLLFGCGLADSNVDLDGNNNARAIVVVDGDGDGLIEISTAQELYNMRYDLLGARYRINNTDEGSYGGCPADIGCVGYELSNDIDLVAFADWEPIGSAQMPFSAIFDGNDFAIDNLRITDQADGANLGFFGAIFSSTIRKIAFNNPSIRIEDTLAINSAGVVVGIILGEQADGTLLQDVAVNTFSVIGSSGFKYIGGLVGYSGGIIESSYATGTGIGIGTGTDVTIIGNLNSNVGGLVGHSKGSISDSYATASIGGGDGDVGGLVGGNSRSGSINNSYATGSIIGGDGDLGGLVGSSFGTIHNSYAGGDVNGVSPNAGGLVGSSRGVISDSSASGNVTAENGNLGGLVGVSFGGVQNNYATGDITGGTGNYENLGGLIGYSGDIIRNSYATGDVNGVSGGEDRAGGLVGNAGFGSAIQNSYATGDVNGGSGAKDRVGGLVGYSSGDILYSYALGNVDGKDGDGDYVGKIASYSGPRTEFFGNYYSDVSTIEGENQRTIDTDEAIEKTLDLLKALTAADTGTEFTSAITTDGWGTKNWDFTADKYPSLKSFKFKNGARVEGDLLCMQGADWVQDDEWVQCPSA